MQSEETEKPKSNTIIGSEMSFMERRKKFFEQGSTSASTTRKKIYENPTDTLNEHKASEQWKEENVRLNRILQDKDMKISDLMKQVEALKSETSERRPKKDEIDSEAVSMSLAMVLAREESLSMKLKSTQSKLERTQIDLSNALMEKATLTKDVEKLEEETARLKEELKQTLYKFKGNEDEERYKRVCEYADQLQFRVGALQNECCKLQKENEEMHDSFQKERRNLKDTLEERDIQIEKYEEQLQQHLQKIKTLDILRRIMTTELEEKTAMVTELQQEANILKEGAYKDKQYTEEIIERAHEEKQKANKIIHEISEDLETKTKLIKQYQEQLESVEYTSARHVRENKVLKIEAANLEQEINQQKMDSLENYEIKEVFPTKTNIGKGSYGSVSMVIVNGMPCIQKRLHDILVGLNGAEAVGEEQQQSISKDEECRLLWQMRHPNIVQFMGIHYNGIAGEINKMSLIMEHLPSNVQECIEKCNDAKAFFPMSIKLSILRDVTYGLAHLHAHDIIHRDLSAANILLTYSMKAKIADLGVSKLVPPYAYTKFTTAPGATYIMPPEALEENPRYSKKLDIFSCGILCLYIVSQKMPLAQDGTLKEEHLRNKQMAIGRRLSHVKLLQSRNPELGHIVIQTLLDEPESRPNATDLSTCIHKCFQKIMYHFYSDLTDFLNSVGKDILVFPDY